MYSSIHEEERLLAYTTQDENGDYILASHSIFQRQETIQGPMLTYIDPITYVTKKSGNPNILIHMNAMKEDDNQNFLDAMQEEMKKLLENDIYEVVPRSLVPRHNTVLDDVWSHPRK